MMITPALSMNCWMNGPINVLSSFDGMSCGMVALERAGIPVAYYFASEIDKYAMRTSESNYPDIVRLGDVQEVRAQGLPKIDLLIGGSPCQGFSLAGKQLNFNDPQSKLFFEFVRLLKECKPTYFLLENVKMKKEYQDIISAHLGVEPIEINSNLVSAQNRKRLYWTNIRGVTQPKDKGIYLKDIIQEDWADEALQSDGWHKWWTEKGEFQLRKKYSSLDADKAICMTARQYASWNGNFISEVFGIANRPRGNNTGGLRNDGSKSPTLSSNAWEHNNRLLKGGKLRKLTVTECCRLQTVPDDYCNSVSNSQAYKMLGNGWKVDVIAHIFKGLK